MGPRTVIGLDLGQAADYSALVIVRENGRDTDGRTVWAVPMIRRWQLGTAYPAIVADVDALARSLDKPALVADATGVGRAVVDLFREASLPVSELVAVTITGGHEVNRVTWEDARVPKRDLVGAVQSALQGRRLKIAKQLPEAATLTRELSTFRVKINVASATESFEAWRERDHDDLVLALALALWVAEEGEQVLEVISFDLDPLAPPRTPRLVYEQLRWFEPHQSFQPIPAVAGQVLLGAPDFRRQEAAALFVRRVHELCGSTPPDQELPSMDAETTAAVEEAVVTFLRVRGMEVSRS
ncbi:MAG TPA: hypothetical protein VH575_25240 [Gemmataceae bacterium]